MIPQVLAAVGVGFASALLPVVSAEAYQAGSSVLQSPPVLVACVAGLALGQTGGKLVIFVASRRGTTLWRTAHGERPSRTPAWARRITARLLRWLSHPVGGPAAVAVSATVGLPPLAVLSATAGASTIRCTTFAAACLAGRITRFATIAGAVTALMT